MQDQPGEITVLLARVRTGDHAAEAKLIPLIYRELRTRAASLMRNERPDHILQPTALVHEAYLRLMAQKEVDWHSRAHFFAVASQVMRRILVDDARARKTEKRGGAARRVEMEDVTQMSGRASLDVDALDEAIARLEQFDLRQGQIVVMRFFAGLTEGEIAGVLGISERTVKRDWRVARAWLRAELVK